MDGGRLIHRVSFRAIGAPRCPLPGERSAICGICGFLNSEPDQSDDVLTTVIDGMVDALQHRGPDDTGRWTDPSAGVGFGHTRLAIIDLSPAGHQPMESACGRYVLTLNGEIYNYRSLRRDMEAAGRTFRGNSDTEVMLAAISEWGVHDAMPRFNGMFAFGLWDRQARLLHLARDQFGEKPLYYARTSRSLLFGSELKALRSHPSFDRALDMDALTLYMRFGYFPAPFSIYRSTSKVLPGSILTFDAANLSSDPRCDRYWSLLDAVNQGQDDPFTGTDDEAVDQLDRLLRTSVQSMMVSDVPLGAFLSGGIDSSTIVAMMQDLSPRPVKTFSIGFHEAAVNEAEHAKAVAAHLGTDHTELYVAPNVAMEVIPHLPQMYDEPLADSSQIPTFLVSEMARRSVTVALTGDAGDELFAGYDQYRSGTKLWSAMQRVPHSGRRAGAAVVRMAPPRVVESGYQLMSEHVLNHPRGQRHTKTSLDRLAGVLPTQSPEAMYRILASHSFDPAALLLGGKEPSTIFTDPGQWPARGDAVTRMTYVDAMMNMPDDILVKVDRASMAVALETRVPILDHHVAEFAWRLPTSMKIRDGRGKWILRTVLDRYVPNGLVDRGKMGFGVPVGDWLRGPLRDWGAALLDERSIRRYGVLQPAPAQELWARHLSGKADHTPLLWTMLMLQAWLEHENSIQ